MRSLIAVVSGLAIVVILLFTIFLKLDQENETGKLVLGAIAGPPEFVLVVRSDKANSDEVWIYPRFRVVFIEGGGIRLE